MVTTTEPVLMEWLKKRMLQERWGLSDFARHVGVQPSTAQGWLRGSRPEWEACAKIAKAFRVSAETVRKLAGYDDEPTAGIVIASPLLAPDEETLLDAYRTAGDAERDALMSIARVVRGTQSRSGTTNQATQRVRPRRGQPPE